MTTTAIIDVDSRLIPLTCRPGDTVLDCGVYHGRTVELFLAAGASRVLGFEPHPESYRALREKYAGDDRVELFEVALSDRDGVAGFQIPDNNPGAGSIVGHFSTGYAEHRDTSLASIEIRTRRLDGLDLPHCDYWKVDVEGAEALLFAGAERLLASRKPRFIQVEIFGPPYNPPDYRPALLRRLEAMLGGAGRLLAVDKEAGLVGLDYEFFYRPMEPETQRRVFSAIRRVATPTFVFWPQGTPPEIPVMDAAAVR